MEQRNADIFDNNCLWQTRKRKEKNNCSHENRVVKCNFAKSLYTASSLKSVVVLFFVFVF